MASAGDGERPRLPDTDDPYVLLGIEPDADHKAIRKAYAQLIRTYRPDRAPVEFQRIHAAFEEVQRDDLRAFKPMLLRALDAARDAGPRERDADPAPVPAAADRPRELDASGTERARERDIARRLDDAVELAGRGDPAAAAAVVDALLDERAPLDLFAQRPEHMALLAGHPSLSWTRLVRASNDGMAIRAVWNAAWLAAYEHDVARARVLLDDDRLRLDAADDVELAAVCLLRIGGLAWTPGRNLAEVLGRYRAAIPMHAALDGLFESVALDLQAAACLGSPAITHAAALREALRALLEAARLGDLERRRAAARAVMAALERDVDAMLGELDALHDDGELGPLFEAIYEHLPIAATRLDRLDKAAFDRLTLALHDVGREPHKWKVLGGAIGGTVLIGASGGLFAGLAVFAGAVGVLGGTEGRRYRRSIRPGLARLLLRLPVTTWVVSRWVQINGRLAGRLSRFDVAIDADRALYALSMFASAAFAIGELDAPDAAGG